MNKNIPFKRIKIIYAVVVSLIMLFASIWLIKDPDIFLRNKWMKELHIRTLGFIGLIFFASLGYSFISLFTRKTAIIVTNDYLVDLSRFESLGKIYWHEITNVQKSKNNNIEISVVDSVFENSETSFFKKYLRFMNGSKTRGGILVSSALLDCSYEEIYETIYHAYSTYSRSYVT